MRHRIVVAATWLAVSAAPLAAQQAGDPRLTAGARIRVERSEIQQVGAPRPVRLVGRLAAFSGDTLFLEVNRGAAPRAIWVPTVDRLWVSQSRGGRRTLRGLAIGALVGGGILGGFAGATASGCTDSPRSLACPDVGTALAVGFAAGALGGAVVGALIGFNTRAERWERVR